MVEGMPRLLGGRYEVGELIGRGGMAEVHIGTDTRLHRTVAIKMLRPDLARDQTFLARFRREAQSAAALNHPSIVAVYDTGEELVTTPAGGTSAVPFIVMEYVQGHTVRELLKDGAAVPIEEAVEIVSGVLSALEYSHHAGIVHRDIKPGNVMLTNAGAIKVMDFGIARAMGDSGATMTATHAVVGTAQYLSPEQARGEVVDARSDLYSTGCLLFELLTGRPPFQGESPVAVAYQHVSEAPPLASSVAADVPEALDRVTVKALAKDRTQRYQTAAEFRADLEAAARGTAVGAPAVGAAAGAAAAVSATSAATAVLGAVPGGTRVIPPTPPTPEPEPEPEPKSRKGLIWTLVLIGIAALAGIVFLVTRGDSPTTPETVAVPSLEGMTEAQARTALDEVGLQMSAQTEVSEDVDEGLAIRWEPSDQADPGSVVTVYFSSGPSAVVVPDVAGLSQARARQLLEGEGLTGDVLTQSEDSPGVAADVAVRTEPAAGNSVAPDTAITLVLGTGNVQVPVLTGQSETDAQATLESLKVSSRIVYQVSATDPPGTVIDQDQSGTVPINATITLVIAQAAPEPSPPPSDTATVVPTDVPVP